MLLLSHLHHDHTQGLPFFIPAYLPHTKLHIFGPDGTHESLKNVLERNQSSETFPVSLREMGAAREEVPARFAVPETRESLARPETDRALVLDHGPRPVGNARTEALSGTGPV